MERNKGINYYLNLPWEIKIKRIPEEEGGGWIASIPLLGEWTCIGDGDTKEEALKDLEQRLKRIIKDYLKRDIPIPEPEQKEEEVKEHSGRILLRMPAHLHFLLAKLAEVNNMSLNSYIIYLLSLQMGLDTVQKIIDEKLNKKLNPLTKRIETMSRRLNDLLNFFIEHKESEKIEQTELKQKIQEQISKPYKNFELIIGGKELQTKKEKEIDAA